MEFLTKSQIREKLDEFLINYDAKNRFQFQESDDREFIQIGQPVERVVSKYQTFLVHKDTEKEQIKRHFFNIDDESEYDKDVRQGNFSR